MNDKNSLEKYLGTHTDYSSFFAELYKIVDDEFHLYSEIIDYSG
jgi:hypothetical protein